MTFQVIKPVQIDDTNLTTTNVAEDDAAEWNSGTTYNTGDQVIIAADHKLYQSVIDSNTNNDPTADDGTNWVYVSMTNPYRMFDRSNTSQTTNADTIEVELQPGQAVTGIALLNCVANTAQVIVEDAVDGEVYNETVEFTNDLGVTDWYEYFFAPVEQIPDVVFLDLPPYSDPTITVIVDRTGSDASVGELVPGYLYTLGDTLDGFRTGIVDYTLKDTDPFGNVNVVERAFSKRSDMTVLIDTSRLSATQRILASMRGSPSVYIGDQDIEALIVYGFYRDFEILDEGTVVSTCSIEIEGLT